jgi:predicted HicB family RNase H-like nuclease
MATDLNSSILGTRPRGRPRGKEYDAAIMLRLPGELRIQVEQRAKAEFLTVATWVRRAMRAELRKKVRL